MPKDVSEAQTLLEDWWNEDPEMRHVEVLCGENLRVWVRLFEVDVVAGDDRQVGSGEAGTLEEAIRIAVKAAS